MCPKFMDMPDLEKLISMHIYITIIYIYLTNLPLSIYHTGHFDVPSVHVMAYCTWAMRAIYSSDMVMHGAYVCSMLERSHNGTDQ